MSYLLDTNACIAALNGRPALVVERLAETRAHRKVISISTMVLTELWYGVSKSEHVERNTRLLEAFIQPFQVLVFDSEDARIAGDIRTRLERLGTPVGPYDCLIAAQAVRHNLTVVTANTREFERVKGLRLENWAK